jgi:rhamnosyltransferase
VKAAEAGSRERVAAVVVAYFPDAGLAGRFAGLAPQVDRLFLIDNGGPSEPQALPGWTVVRNPANLGVGAALNQGMQLALAAECGWLLTLDQDTSPAADLVARLLQVVREHQDRVHLAIVASTVEDPEVGVHARFLRRRFGPVFERAECHGDRLDDVTLAISAGSLHRLDVLARLGGFREDFFIDYVDSEYCLRAKAAGYRIAVACRARLGHKLGSRRRAALAGLVFFPTNHPPQRWYYIARNRVPMIRLYARRFAFWLTYDLVAGAYALIRMLLFETNRRRKLQALALGTLDGLRGRMGPAPENRRFLGEV